MSEMKKHKAWIENHNYYHPSVGGSDGKLGLLMKFDTFFCAFLTVMMDHCFSENKFYPSSGEAQFPFYVCFFILLFFFCVP